MNDTNAFERFVADQFDRARDTDHATERLHQDITLQAARTRQRPRWLALIKEPPMRISSTLAVGSPMARVAAMMVATLLIALSVAGAGVAGARLLAADGEGVGTAQEPSIFTGAWSEELDVTGVEAYDWSFDEAAEVAESLDNTSTAMFEATDPRLSGLFTQTLSVRSFPVDYATDAWAMVWTAAVRIENEDGAWAGVFDGFANESHPREWYQLEGEGEYEGLTAIMLWHGEDETYEGVIVPGALPDYPAPIEPIDVAPEDEESAV